MPQTKNQQAFFRKELVKELRRVEKFITNEPHPEKKLYYFSAAFGATGRTFRYSFGRDVLLADFVLTSTYGLMMDRINRLKQGDQTVLIEEIHFSRLSEGLRLLADRIESDEPIQEALELILCTAFSTTGPGNYLMEKGELAL